MKTSPLVVGAVICLALTAQGGETNTCGWPCTPTPLELTTIPVWLELQPWVWVKDVDKLVVYLTMMLIVIQAVISWVNPFSPLAPVFYALSRPALAPFQRLIKPISGVDLSPLVALVVLQLLLIAPLAGLARLARQLMGLTFAG